METTPRHTRWNSLQHHLLSAAATVAVGAIVIALLNPGKGEPPAPREADNEQASPARVIAHGEVSVVPDTPLARKLTFATVSADKLSTPILSATGAVIARLAIGAGTTRAAGTGGAEPTTRTATERGREFPAWDFGSPDLLTTYTAWIQSQADVKFDADEVAKIHALDEAKIADLQKSADRSKELAKQGAESQKDLQAAESGLLQAKLQAEKDIYEATKALKDAEKTQANLARQLIQADAPPELLVNGREGTIIVAADVPESRVMLIQEGAACQARFYRLPDVTFSGKVGRLGAVLVKDRRTLRVLFVIQDPQNRLRSNMFAEVGLGTDAREAIVVPVDALLHDGGADYVLVAGTPNIYRATEVMVGDPVGGTRVEILKGLKVGDHIISTGDILLKPYVVKALEEVN